MRNIRFYTSDSPLPHLIRTCLRLGANTRVRSVVQTALISAGAGDKDTAAAWAQSIITAGTTTETTSAAATAAGRYFHEMPVRGHKAIAMRGQHRVQPLAHASLKLDALRHFEFGVRR
jgi:hypothetical protein